MGWKGIAFALILLFVASSVSSSVTSMNLLNSGSDRKVTSETIYVDGNNNIITDLPNQLCAQTNQTFKEPLQ